MSKREGGEECMAGRNKGRQRRPSLAVPVSLAFASRSKNKKKGEIMAGGEERNV